MKRIILLSLIVTAFLLRWYLIPSHLFFGPEQGRDFLVVRDIVVGHKPTLIGSKTDIAGIFHGPIFYYLASVPFALSRGDPLWVCAFFIALQSAGVLLAYQLGFELTGKRRAGLIAAVLFAVSYLLIVYARWLSNPPLSIPLSFLFILFFLRFIRGKSWYAVGTAVTYGLLGQAEFINFLLFGVIGVLACLIYRKKIKKTKPLIAAVACIVGFIASFATYVLFDFRHNALITHGIVDLLAGKTGYKLDLMTSTVEAFRVFFQQASGMVGLSGWVAGLILVILLMAQQNNRILLLWLWVPPVIFSVLRHGMLDQLYVGVIGVFVIYLALLIDWLLEKRRIAGVFAFAFVLILNISAIARNLPGNDRVFFQPQQPDVRYTDQKSVIDWVYARAAGRPFEFQAYTIPYFWQDAWIYLFDWYGFSKFGYKPTAVDRKLLYVIVQKDRLDPMYQKNWYDETVSTWGKKSVNTTIGEYMVEERTPEN
jgi:4-amino-4-deoxy-L-arabinose transferase-like glycosyltransferase